MRGRMLVDNPLLCVCFHLKLITSIVKWFPIVLAKLTRNLRNLPRVAFGERGIKGRGLLRSVLSRTCPHLGPIYASFSFPPLFLISLLPFPYHLPPPLPIPLLAPSLPHSFLPHTLLPLSKLPPPPFPRYFPCPFISPYFPHPRISGSHIRLLLLLLLLLSSHRRRMRQWFQTGSTFIGIFPMRFLLILVGLRHGRQFVNVALKAFLAQCHDLLTSLSSSLSSHHRSTCDLFSRAS